MKIRAAFILISLTLLTACSSQIDVPTVTEAPVVTLVDTPEPADTPAPTATAPAPLVILLAPDGVSPELSARMEAEVSSLAAARGLRWQLRQSMSPAEVATEANFLIALPPQANLNALVAAAPQTHFLAVGIPDVTAAPNLILVRAQGGSEEIEAFMGGYIAALLTPDWRIGIITTEDDLSQTRFAAFENGMRFFCGLCRPQYAPFYEYPFLLSLPATASAVEWRALADFMRDRFVGAVYVSPGTGGDDLINALADYEINIIGSTDAPPGREGIWVASLRSDPTAAYLEYIPRLLDGEGGIDITLPLQLLDVNAELLTAGKLRLAEATLADLLAGYILPGSTESP